MTRPEVVWVFTNVAACVVDGVSAMGVHGDRGAGHTAAQARASAPLVEACAVKLPGRELKFW